MRTFASSLRLIDSRSGTLPMDNFLLSDGQRKTARPSNDVYFGPIAAIVDNPSERPLNPTNDFEAVIDVSDAKKNPAEQLPFARRPNGSQ